MTASRYIPLDIDYPTNFPDGNNIPVPSGLLKDIGISNLLMLESNSKSSKQGWVWTGARTTLSSSASELEPAKAFNQFSGYKNPTITPATGYDYSTVGLQVSGQVRSNTELEPIVLAIPFNFSNIIRKVIKVSLTGQVFARSALNNGVGISVGWVCWRNGVRIQRSPYDWIGALDPSQDDEDVIFNLNPDLPLGTDIKYFAPSDNLADQLRLFELEVPHIIGSPNPIGPGFILISIVTFPGSVTVTGGEGLERGTDWNWLIRSTVVDPNHIDFTKANFTFGDNFTDGTASTKSTSGSKFPAIGAKPLNWMIKINTPSTTAETRSPFTYHNMLQLRAGGQPGNYSSAIGRAMIYPFIGDDFIRQGGFHLEPGWEIDVFPMSTLILTSIYIEESVITAEGENLITTPISTYLNRDTDSGSKALASTLASLIDDVNSVLLSPTSFNNCSHRVKGPNTIGKLVSFEVLEKNEAFSWFFYDPEETYGVLSPGISFPINYGSFNIEGWNKAVSYLFIESCTPKRDVVTSGEPEFSIDNLLDGEDQALGLDIKYPLSVGKQGTSSGYNVSTDKTIAYMPFNGAWAPLTGGNGIPISQFEKGGSFNTPGMLDRYYSDNINPGYRVLSDLYPLLDDAGSTDLERASGFTNNYSTAGAVAYFTIESIWGELPGQNSRVSFLGESYNSTGLISRGNLEIVGPTGTNPGIRDIDAAMVFVVYGSAYVPFFTQDPS